MEVRFAGGGGRGGVLEVRFAGGGGRGGGLEVPFAGGGGRVLPGHVVVWSFTALN